MAILLPDFVKPVRDWVPIGLSGEDGNVSVYLDGGDEEIEITRRAVVVSLRPLVFAVGSPDAADARAALAIASPRMRFCESDRPTIALGVIRLKRVGSIGVDGARLELFRARGHVNRCLSRLRMGIHHLRSCWRLRVKRSRSDFGMRCMDIPRLWVFYIRPRPVVLVTVRSDGESNIFPMDLIGPTGTPFFSLSLRTASPSIGAITATRRVALSEVGLDQTQIVYELGKHHRSFSADWSRLSSRVFPSPRFGLPVPDFALRVREMTVEAVHEVGSHSVFLCRPVSDEQVASGPVLHHVHGSFEAYRQRSGRPFVTMNA